MKINSVNKLDTGSQPMFNEVAVVDVQAFGVVCNGEIPSDIFYRLFDFLVTHSTGTKYLFHG